MKFRYQPRGVIFDLDGLLIDTVPLYATAMVRASKDIGHALTRQYVLTLVGLLGAELRQQICADRGASFPLDRYFEAVGARLKELLHDAVPLKPGAAELVQALSDRGVPLAVATSLTTAEAERHLQTTGLRSVFAAIATRDDVARSKPHPDVYLEAAARLQVEVHHCVALEDSHNGIRSAHAAGAMAIMVPDTLAPTPEIEALCAGVARDLAEVQTVLCSSLPANVSASAT